MSASEDEPEGGIGRDSSDGTCDGGEDNEEMQPRAGTMELREFRARLVYKPPGGYIVIYDEQNSGARGPEEYMR